MQDVTDIWAVLSRRWFEAPSDVVRVIIILEPGLLLQCIGDGKTRRKTVYSWSEMGYN